jgi:hypothetical protein
LGVSRNLSTRKFSSVFGGLYVFRLSNPDLETITSVLGKEHNVLSHVITGKNNGTYSMTWMGHGIVATLTGIHITPGESDAVSIEKGKIKIEVASSKSLSVKIVAVGVTSKLPRMATLTTNASAKGTIQLSFDPKAETYEYTHHGKATDYGVEFSTVDAIIRGESQLPRSVLAL